MGDAKNCEKLGSWAFDTLTKATHPRRVENIFFIAAIMFFNGQVKTGKSNAGLLKSINEKPFPKLPYPLLP
jgi:hypothetical protein